MSRLWLKNSNAPMGKFNSFKNFFNALLYLRVIQENFGTFSKKSYHCYKKVKNRCTGNVKLTFPKYFIVTVEHGLHSLNHFYFIINTFMPCDFFRTHILLVC